MPEGSIEICGMTFGMLTVVGIVRNIDHSSTKITYTLEDHTGRIDAHLWLEEGDTANSPSVLLNTYARCHGSIRIQNGTKIIMIFKLEPLDTVNELTTHLLEALLTRYQSDFFSHGGGKLKGDSTNNAGGMVPAHENAQVDLGLKGKQLLVYEAVRNHKTEEGISTQELLRKFTHIPSAELK